MLFKFAKNAGEKMTGAVSNIFKKNKLDDSRIEAVQQGDQIVLKGTAKTQAEAEKMIVAAGNNAGVTEVESQIVVEEKAPEATFYEVVSGDSLSKIAKAHYGDAMKYPAIFEANKPMLSHPDKIYPGQVLRIPPLDGASA